MDKLESDFSLIDDAAKTHAGWPAFVQAMENRQYGAALLNSTWAWFRDGWDAQAQENDSRLSTWLRTKRLEIEKIFDSDEQSRAARATITLVIDFIARGAWRLAGS